MNPVCIFIVLWAGVITISIFLWKPEYTWNYSGVLWILLACFACLIGGFCAQKIKLKGTGKDKVIKKLELNKSCWRYLFIIVILAFIKVPLDLRMYGFPISNLFKVSSWGTVSGYIASERYNEGGAFSIIGQVLGLFIYLAPLFAGFCLNYSKKKRHIFLCLLSFLPIVLEVILTTGKAGFVASVMLFFIGNTSGYLSRNGKDMKVSKKLILKFFLLAIIVFGFLFWAMLWRAGGNLSEIPIIIDKAFVYAFGSVPSFDNWLGNYYTFKPGFGKETFYAISSFLGVSTRRPGIYDMLDGYSQSNVYTCFRGLIQDFGAIGGLFIVFLLGFIGGLAYRIIKSRGKHFWLWLIVYQITIFYSIYGLIISPWTYTSFILIFPMFFICVILSCKSRPVSKTIKVTMQYVKS